MKEIKKWTVTDVADRFEEAAFGVAEVGQRVQGYIRYGFAKNDVKTGNIIQWC